MIRLKKLCGEWPCGRNFVLEDQQKSTYLSQSIPHHLIFLASLHKIKHWFFFNDFSRDIISDADWVLVAGAFSSAPCTPSTVLDSFAWTFNLIFYLVYVDVLENKDWTASFIQVYVVGEDGILEELKLAGFECFGGSVRLVILCLHFFLSRTRTRAAKRKKRGEPRVI